MYHVGGNFPVVGTILSFGRRLMDQCESVSASDCREPGTRIASTINAFETSRQSG